MKCTEGALKESVKLCALRDRAPRAVVPHVPHALRAPVFYVPRALRASYPTCCGILRALCPTCSCALRVLVSYVFLRTSRLLCLVCSRAARAWCPTCTCAPRLSHASGFSSLTCSYASHVL